MAREGGAARDCLRRRAREGQPPAALAKIAPVLVVGIRTQIAIRKASSRQLCLLSPNLPSPSAVALVRLQRRRWRGRLPLLPSVKLSLRRNRCQPSAFARLFVHLRLRSCNSHQQCSSRHRFQSQERKCKRSTRTVSGTQLLSTVSRSCSVRRSSHRQTHRYRRPSRWTGLNQSPGRHTCALLVAIPARNRVAYLAARMKA